jgi:hypothetical protein
MNAIRSQGYLPQPRANPPNTLFLQPKLLRQRGDGALFFGMQPVNLCKQKDHMEFIFHMIHIVPPRGLEPLFEIQEG